MFTMWPLSSCSSDGSILNWTVLETSLVATLITVVPFTGQIKSEVSQSHKCPKKTLSGFL